MRPRHEASENLADVGQSNRQIFASMRPRHEASENSTARFRCSLRSPRFNEAEARGLGKLALGTNILVSLISLQ